MKQIILSDSFALSRVPYPKTAELEKVGASPGPENDRPVKGSRTARANPGKINFPENWGSVSKATARVTCEVVSHIEGAEPHFCSGVGGRVRHPPFVFVMILICKHSSSNLRKTASSIMPILLRGSGSRCCRSFQRLDSAAVKLIY